MSSRSALSTFVLMLGITGALQASEDGKELFMKKCSACHKTRRPADISTLVAPPIPGVAMHVKMKYPQKDQAVAFIKEYVLHPDRAKAQCMPQTIQKFGLMPSQQGSVTPEELEKIARYIVENYPDRKFAAMHQAQEGGMGGPMGASGAKKKGMGKKASPFLISKGLPHLTKLIAQRWDDPELGLTPEQKSRLMEVRRETMAGVKRYKPQVMQLERKIRQAILSGADPKDLAEDLRKLADLKRELSMIHLQCIARTKKELTPEQFAMLLPKNSMSQGGRGMGQGPGRGKRQGGCGQTPPPAQ